MTLNELLSQLGLNIASNISTSFIEGLIRRYRDKNLTFDGLRNELVSHLNIENADIKADKIIQFLAENGNIDISSSQIYATKSIAISSSHNTKFSFGNNSTSRTDKSSIAVGHGAQIQGQGGGSIKQDEDGNIKFYT